MKKLLFSSAALAACLLLAFCNKSSIKDELQNSTQNATNRTQCKVQVFPLVATALTYCGTGTNSDTCNDNCVGKQEGVETVMGDFAFDIETTDTFKSFSISSATGNSVIVTAGANQIGPLVIPAGGCITVSVDFNCVVF